MIRGAMTVAALALALGTGFPGQARSAEAEILDGVVTVVEPQGSPRGLVELFSDRDGWGKDDEAAAQALARQGALVVRIDSPTYLARFSDYDETCHWTSGDVEKLSRRLQRERDWPGYLVPIIAGRGEGGTLAQMAVTQAPPATFAGAVSLDPASAIASPRPLCSKVPPTKTPAGFRYGPTGPLSGFWAVGLTSAASSETRPYLRAFRAQGVPFTVTKLTGLPDQGPRLAAMVEAQLAAGSAGTGELPLVELPAAGRSPLMAVILSGDGGWRDIDKSIADYFQRQGVPVVGLDSLRYFWSRKTPEQTASDLAKVLKTYRTRWHADKVALIGYSFGADVLPFVYNRLAASEQAHIGAVALLGLARATDFEIHVQGWMGQSVGGDALRVGPEIERMPRGLVQCYYGEEDAESACRGLDPNGVEGVRTLGGHHFGGDYDQISRQILDGFRRRAGP